MTRAYEITFRVVEPCNSDRIEEPEVLQRISCAVAAPRLGETVDTMEFLSTELSSERTANGRRRVSISRLPRAPEDSPIARRLPEGLDTDHLRDRGVHAGRTPVEAASRPLSDIPVHERARASWRYGTAAASMMADTPLARTSSEADINRRQHSRPDS